MGWSELPPGLWGREECARARPSGPVVEPPPIETEAGLAFEVDRILDVRVCPEGREFLVRWVGYGAEDDSWEPEDGFIDRERAPRAAPRAATRRATRAVTRPAW